MSEPKTKMKTNTREVVSFVVSQFNMYPTQWEQDKVESMVESIEEILADKKLEDKASVVFDRQDEICSNLVDISNFDLVQWLGENFKRAFIIDEATEELGGKFDTLEGIRAGQMHVLTRLYWELATKILEDKQKLCQVTEL